MAGQYVVDADSGKMVLKFDKSDYLALPSATRDEIKRYFNFSRYQSGWISKGQADSYMPQEIAKKLGFQQGGTVGERRSFAEKMEAKAERAEERAERYSEYAENAQRRGQSMQRGIEEHRGDIAFFTQPVTPNSGGRAFANYREKLFARYHKGFEEYKKAEYFKEQSERLSKASSLSQLQNRSYLDNRIKEGEANLRKLTKNAEGYYSNPESMEKYPEYAEKLERQTEDEVDKLNYFKAAMERLGGVQYNKENVHKGDRVKIRHGWAIVKSAGPKNINVIIAAGGAIGMELKYSYAEIQELKQGKVMRELPEGYKLVEYVDKYYPQYNNGLRVINPKGEQVGGTYKKKESAIEYATAYEEEHKLSPKKEEAKPTPQPEQKPEPKVLALPQSAPYSMRELQGKNADRRTTSSLIDSMRSHKITVSPDNPRVRRWAKDPGSMDVLGIDNPPSVTQPTRGISRSRMPRISPRTPRLR